MIGEIMKKQDKKIKIIITCCFVLGLVLYLSGLFLIFGTTLSKLDFARNFFYRFPLTNNIIDNNTINSILCCLINSIKPPQVPILYNNS